MSGARSELAIPVCRPPLLIQVVPRLLPGSCGVSDNALLLARELKRGFGIDPAFAVLNSTERRELAETAVYCPPAKLVENALELTRGRPGFILLHVSGYGYSADGAPRLLADALDEAKATGRFHAAAYFHETYATGPPWKSAFWYTRRQQRELRRIVARSDLVVTNTGWHAQWLRRQSAKAGGMPITVLPVISAAGETSDPVPFVQRKAVLVVFGSRGTRALAYRQMAATGNLLRELEIEEIVDIGSPCAAPAAVKGVPVKAMGMVPGEDLPAVFSQARFGFVSHEWFCLAKSSVFATCCAQGTIPVSAGPFPRPVDGLEEGVHVVTQRTIAAARQTGWELCSRAVWTWYMEHGVRVHAEHYARWMGLRS